MMLWFGGSPSPSPSPSPSQPTSTTAYNTSIPEYAAPYVTNMLEATQQQLFNVDANKQITGFKPYQPYSTDVNNYFAGFSPLQQQAQQSVANMRVPGQYGQASNIAGAAGLGSLGAGANYVQQATNPYSMQAYMSPYIQNALQPQLEEMQRQYGITGQQERGRATAAGAFGGTRQALMQAENERNKNMAMNQAIGQGYQNAFQNAQQAQQFGANLGLQGYSQAGTLANTYAGIGGQDLAAQQSIAQAQNTAGGQQQALEQQKINQGIQNYATQQQYPLMQLGMMSNMLRGLPMQATTTQSYQAAPSGLTQTIAGVGALGSLAGAMKKEGGVIKGLAGGGAVQHYDVGGRVRAQLENMPVEQLQQVMQTTTSNEVRQMAAQILAEHKLAAQAEQGAGAGRGLDAANTGSMFTNMAGGGIIAFANEGEVPKPAEPTEKSSLEDYAKYIQSSRQGLGVVGAPRQAERESLETRGAELYSRESRERYLAAARFFADMGTRPGGVVTAALGSAKDAVPEVVSMLGKQNQARDALAKTQADIAEADRLEKLGLVDKAMGMREKAIKEANDIRIKEAEIAGRLEGTKITAGAHLAAANAKTGQERNQQQGIRIFAAKIANETGRSPDDPFVQAHAAEMYFAAAGMAGPKLYQQGLIALESEVTKRIEKDQTLKDLRRDMLFADKPEEKAIIQTKIEEQQQKIRAELTAALGRQPATPAPTPAPAPNAAAPAARKPITKAEYDALSSGSTYTAPDGSQRVKP